MEGLKYLAAEIEYWRTWLHRFIENPDLVKDMVTGTVPTPFIINGKLVFLEPKVATEDAKHFAELHGIEFKDAARCVRSYRRLANLTLEEVARLLPLFYAGAKTPEIQIPIKPNLPPPAGYTVEELKLIFSPGAIERGACLDAQMVSGNRRFHVAVRHDWLAPDYRESDDYLSYKRTLRKAADLKDVRFKDIKSELIQIDKNTRADIIWTQLLLCAQNQGYLWEYDNNSIESLRYLLTEFEARRCLLHKFVKNEYLVADIVNGGAENPQEYAYIDNGNLTIFLPPEKADPNAFQIPAIAEFYANRPGHLQGVTGTFSDLKGFLPDFYDSQIERAQLELPIKPAALTPNGCAVEELKLVFYLGMSGQGAYLFARIRSINKRHVFQVQFYHDRMRSNYKNSEGYESYKKIRRRAGNLENLGARIIPFRIQVDEKTDPRMIWTQLLVCAVNQGYLSVQSSELLEELKVIHPYVDGPEASETQQLRAQVFDDLIMHLSRHRLYPYSPQSFPAYAKTLKKVYKKKSKDFQNIDLTAPQDKFVQSKRPYQNSVPAMAMTLGMSQDAIYRRIKRDKNLAYNNSSGYLELTPEAVATLMKEQRLKDRRKEIIAAAKSLKSKAAIKKFLYRHENPSDSAVARWLAKGS